MLSRETRNSDDGSYRVERVGELNALNSHSVSCRVESAGALGFGRNFL